MNFEKQKKEYVKVLDKTIKEVLTRSKHNRSLFDMAVDDAINSGGKRIRPLMCFGAAVAAGGKAEGARYAAAAIEFLHNYTLVHDDLPAMDNDELRRGMPTIWKKYGEANAILVGDYLQAIAFDSAVMTEMNPESVVSALAIAAGAVVRGQFRDLELQRNPEKKSVSQVEVMAMYSDKTASLFYAAASMGALAVDADDELADALGRFGALFGEMFQLQDDLLDGDSVFSDGDIRVRIEALHDLLVNMLHSFPGDTTFLRELLDSLMNRTK